MKYDRLKEALEYEPASGVFTWREQRGGGAKVGAVAGHLNHYGYVQIKVDKKIYPAHRLAWLWMTGDWPTKACVDHINGIPADNRWCNLREATHLENKGNTKLFANNKSGHRGVHRRKSIDKESWQVVIHHNNKAWFLGTFDTKDEAAAMFQGAAKLLRGDFAADR